MIKSLKNLIRLFYIKRKKAVYMRICKKCGETIYPKEIYFSVARWYVDRQIIKMTYCTECMKTRKEVLNEIDTDNYPYGIAKIDNYKK